MYNLINKVLKKVMNSDRDYKDEHEECYTQAYGSVRFEIKKPTIPYKVEPKHLIPSDEIDEYDCTRVR